MPREQTKPIPVNWGYLLDNGNIVIPQIISREPLFVGWVEVEPGTAEHKRFLAKARREPDIRQTEPYRSYVLSNFPQFAWTLEGVYRVP